MTFKEYFRKNSLSELVNSLENSEVDSICELAELWYEEKKRVDVLKAELRIIEDIKIAILSAQSEIVKHPRGKTVLNAITGSLDRYADTFFRSQLTKEGGKQ